MGLPFSTHSLGGRIAFRMSSLLGFDSMGGSCVFFFVAKELMSGCLINNKNRRNEYLQPNVFLKGSLGSYPAEICSESDH